jgi:hypothetical protein
MRVLCVADDAGIGAGHRPARPGKAWTATVASAWMGQALTVASLPRPAAYPSAPGSVG